MGLADGARSGTFGPKPRDPGGDVGVGHVSQPVIPPCR
jgi:hypothetical protein